jgi:malate dehydrogenase (oxaloacetate-decarboxylating)
MTMSKEKDAINLHRMLKGKIEIHNRVSLDSAASKDKNGTLELIYTPGVAYLAKEVSTNKELTYNYTSKWNNVAIVCDGTRVLGIGNIGSSICSVNKQIDDIRICIAQYGNQKK